MYPKTFCSMLGLLLVAGAGAQAAPANDTESTSGPTPSGATELAEIVVTAQRREESVEKVGATITAISGQEIQDARIREPLDIANLTPGLSTLNRTADDAPTFAIRGVGLDDFNPNNTSGTAVYMDGIYETGPVFLSGPMFDVQRVEVLKGPQGTLYGKNATGGAINIISNGPDVTDNNYVTAGYGRWNTAELRAAVGGPLGNGFSARAAASVTYQGTGFQTDVDTGRHYGRTEQYGTRFMLQYAGDFATTLLNVHASQDSSVPSSYEHDMTVIPGCPECAQLFDVTPPSATRVRVGDLQLKRDETVYGASLTTKAPLSPGDLVVILGYDRTHHFNADNQDGVPQALYDYTQDEAVQQFYAETRLTSSAPLFERTDWLVGASYSWQKFLSHDFTDQSIGQIGLFETPPDLSLVRGLSIAQANVTQRPSGVGIFFHTSTKLVEGLRLVAGARYSDESIGVNGRTTENGSDDGGILFHGIGSTVVALDETHSSHLPSYKAGLEWDITSDILSYASVSTGTKSGVYYLGPAVDPASWRYVQPEKLKSYEVGLKGRYFGGKAIVNASVFDYDYRDRQTSVAFVSQVTGFFAASLDNLPKARIRGADLDVMLRPWRGLTLSASGTFLDSEVVQTITNVSGQPLLIPLPPGSALAQAPRWTYTVRGAYSWALGAQSKANLELNFKHTGTQIDAEGDPLGEYGPDNDLSARASVDLSDALQLGLWGRNLTNNHDLTVAFLQIVGRTIYIERPTSYGVDFTYRF